MGQSGGQENRERQCRAGFFRPPSIGAHAGSDAVKPQPEDIDVSLSQGVAIRWNDGHLSRYEIKYLRDSCPCATCTDAHATGERPTATAGGVPLGTAALPIYRPTGATLRSVQPIGRYALQFVFSDDHSTGLFTWEYLREICPCSQCRSAKSGGSEAASSSPP
jgi:DUF971 family protein